MDQNTTETNYTHPTPGSELHSERTLLGVISYIGPLFIVSFFASKNDPFIKFHIKQGMVLFIFEIIVTVLMRTVWGLWPLWQIINLGLLALAIIGIVHVANHQEKILPVIGRFAAKFRL